ncbi:putative Ig domain-containing protein [Dactylosporangium sp. CS-047395]|uniref:putative Ig domain-containing protein n=1 Tax=Dactylosporangium sp. CS-047395 TaxID=3239936 RepID=UPI003D903943
MQKRLTGAFGVCLIMLAVAGRPVAAAAAPAHHPESLTLRAFVASNWFSWISYFDVASDTKLGNGRTGNWGPNDLVIAPDGSKIYASGLAGNVVTIDPSTMTITSDVNLGDSLYGLALSPDGSRLYTANPSGGKVYVVSTATMTKVDTITGLSYPMDVALSKDGTRLYAADGSGLAVVKLSDGSLITRVPTGSFPYRVAVSPDGGTVAVTDHQDNNVSLIDTATNTKTGSVITGARPNGLAFTPDGTAVWVADENGNDVAVVDLDSKTRTGVIPLGSSTGPYGVGFTPDGTKAYVSNINAGSVSIINTGTKTVTSTVPNVGGGLQDVVVGLVDVHPVVSTATLPGALTGTAYNASLQAANLAGTPAWSVQSGTLPAGLTLDAATGAITGTPTGPAGTATVTFAVTNGTDTATKALDLTVQAALSGSTAPVPPGVVGRAYTASLTATGGTAPYTYALTTGALPTGLSLDQSTGAVTGTPTGPAGATQFAVTVTDTDGATDEQTYTLTVVPEIAITGTTVPAAGTGAAYTATIGVAGGLTPYGYAVTAGALPAGLSLDPATGELSGTPSASAGTYNFTVTVTDGGGGTAAQAFALTLTAAPTVNTNTLPDAVAGTAFTGTLAAGGGTAPFTWSIVAGALPAGLSLDPSTGALTGTPTTAGTANFTVRATDAGAATVDKALTIVVHAALALPAPVLPAATVGAPYTASVTATGGLPPYSYSVTSGLLPPGLALNPASGAITGTPTGPAGDYTATVTVNGSVNQTITVHVGVDAPSGVTATAQVSSIQVGWTPSSAAGVTGYTATASPGGATCTATGAQATGCVLGAVAGTPTTVTVVANAPTGDSAASTASAAVTATAPVAPATPPAPTTTTTLTTDRGNIEQLAAGEQITFIGSGFAPHSTVVITLYSTPQTLGTVTTDGNGAFSAPITVPADLATGAHTVSAQGAAPDGTVRTMALAVTVAAAADAPASSPALAVTGTDLSGPLTLGLLLLAVGLGLFLGGRRARRA